MPSLLFGHNHDTKHSSDRRWPWGSKHRITREFSSDADNDSLSFIMRFVSFVKARVLASMNEALGVFSPLRGLN